MGYLMLFAVFKISRNAVFHLHLVTVAAKEITDKLLHCSLIVGFFFFFFFVCLI